MVIDTSAIIAALLNEATAAGIARAIGGNSQFQHDIYINRHDLEFRRVDVHHAVGDPLAGEARKPVSNAAFHRAFAAS